MAIMKNVTVYWAKVLGEPVPKFNPEDGREWAIDLCFTPEQVAQLKKEGMTTSFYIKDKEDERGQFFTYRRNELRKDGEKSKPLGIVSIDGEPWPKDKPLGNGTVVDIRYALNEVTARPKNRMKLSLIEMMVREHKPYESAAKETFEFDKTKKPKVAEETWDE